jgi:hypothetical protein
VNPDSEGQPCIAVKKINRPAPRELTVGSINSPVRTDMYLRCVRDTPIAWVATKLAHPTRFLPRLSEALAQERSGNGQAAA